MTSFRHQTSGGSSSSNIAPAASGRPYRTKPLLDLLIEPHELADDDDVVEPAIPQDPARVAARLLLQRALSSAETAADEVGRDGAVCIVTLPSSDWTDPVQDEWRDQFRNGHPALDGRRNHSWERSTWISWSPVECPRPPEVREASEAFIHSVSRGRHCVGFTADPSWLPPDLLNAADHRLTLPLPTAADVSELVFVLTSHRPEMALSDSDAAMLTPRLLRLARRPDQAPNAYVAKLRDLLERDRTACAIPAVGVRSIREKPVLARLHGMDEAVAWGERVARDLDAFRAGSIAWADVDRGCLLSGPPGCGKTLFAQALAATCNAELVTGSYGQWLGTGTGHQGTMLKAMRDTFALARSKAPSILFIDEVDSFPNRATVIHHYADWEMQVVNALLAEVDGVEGREGVILLAACNHPEKLDPALLRSGRLDRHIRVDLPGCADLERILREHLAGELAEVPLAAAALAASGSSGADCERIIRGARRRAREAGRSMVLLDLMAEIEGVDDRTEADLWLAAVHEAGHAVASCEWYPGALQAVTLRGGDGVGGRTVVERNGGSIRVLDVQRRLTELLAGRAAEEVFFGQPSSGAGGGVTSDLARATLSATMARTSLGLDDATGLVWSGMPAPATLPSMLAADPALAAGVRAALDEAYERAVGLVRRRRGSVEAVATALMERRALDGEEVATIVARNAERLGADAVSAGTITSDVREPATEKVPRVRQESLR